jgi:hypothetical protein
MPEKKSDKKKVESEVETHKPTQCHQEFRARSRISVMFYGELPGEGLEFD